ncbi:MAG: hypothetical protein JWO38_3782 [Gemmataceae bacterium]|nr:hypothetical protein [Gemmataceae bacterium]
MRMSGSVARPGWASARLMLNNSVLVSDYDTLPNGPAPTMLSSTDRPAVNNLFRPSLLAWRAKHLAEKAARANKLGDTTPKQPEAIRTPAR